MKTPRPPAPRAVELSERDIARVLHAMLLVDTTDSWWDTCVRFKPSDEDGAGEVDTTPEGWPLPSRELLAKIKELL